MSKYVKNLIADHLRDRLQGVNEALLVDVIGMDAKASHRLRAELRARNVNLMVVKNSLAARATADTPLGPLFEGVTGSAAVCWGGEDIVTLAKEVARLAKDEQYAPFKAHSGVMDGQKLSGQQVEEVSKWPSREEVLGQLMGQILGPGARLAAQLNGPASTLAGQIARKAEQEGEGQHAAEGT